MLNLDHAVFPVSDAEASLDFYGGVLGLPLVGAVTGDDWGGKAWLMLIFGLADGRELVLVAARGARAPSLGDLAPDMRHYAFSVDTAAEQDAWRAKLRSAGIAFCEEDHGHQRSIYFPDPDGVILEITTPPSATPQVAVPAALTKARAWIAAAQGSGQPALTG